MRALLLSVFAVACAASPRSVPSTSAAPSDPTAARVARVEPVRPHRAELEGPSPDAGPFATPVAGMVSGLDPVVVRSDALATFRVSTGIPAVLEATRARAEARAGDLRFARTVTMQVETVRQKIRFGAVVRSCPNREIDPRPCDPDSREGTREEIPEGPPMTTNTKRSAVLGVDFGTRPVYRYRCRGADALIDVSLDPVISTDADVLAIQSATRTELRTEDETTESKVAVTVKTKWLDGETPIVPRYVGSPLFNASRDPKVFTTLSETLHWAAGECQ